MFRLNANIICVVIAHEQWIVMIDCLMCDCVVLLNLERDAKSSVALNDDMSGQKIVLKIALKVFF